MKVTYQKSAMRMRLEMTGVIVYTTDKMWCYGSPKKKETNLIEQFDILLHQFDVLHASTGLISYCFSCVLVVSPSSQWPPLVNKAYIQQGVNSVILG